jgi:elongation factor P
MDRTAPRQSPGLTDSTTFVLRLAPDDVPANLVAAEAFGRRTRDKRGSPTEVDGAAGQTLVRIKMRNLLTRRAVFDKTFKAGDRFQEPDLVVISAAFLYADGDGCHFMDQDTFETLTLRPDVLGDDRLLLADNVLVQIQKFNGNTIGAQLPTIVELKVTHSEPGVRGDTASGGVTKVAVLETGLEIRAALHQGEEKVKVHSETREFAGRV